MPGTDLVIDIDAIDFIVLNSLSHGRRRIGGIDPQRGRCFCTPQDGNEELDTSLGILHLGIGALERSSFCHWADCEESAGVPCQKIQTIVPS